MRNQTDSLTRTFWWMMRWGGIGTVGVLLVSGGAVGQVQRGNPLPRKAALGAELLPSDLGKGARAQGVRIGTITSGLSAERLGLKTGDVILKINGAPMTSPAGVLSWLRTQAGGASVKLEIMRGTGKMNLSGSLSERPRQVSSEFVVGYDQVMSKGKRIRIITTRPKGDGQFPALFMIGGIGEYSIDGDFETSPYGRVLGPLAKSGYAIIRVEKPGIGDSEGPPYSELMFEDESDAYLQALRLTKTMPFVDKYRIAIFGHSMGGVFAPIVASQEPVAGVAVCGTMTKTWSEYMVENTRRQSLLAGSRAPEVDSEIKKLSAVCHYLFHEGLTPESIVKKHPDLAEFTRLTLPGLKTYSGVNIKFFQQLARINLMDYWSKTEAPVLAIWGENDFLSAEWDHEFLAKTVNLKRPNSAKYVRLGNSDHGFNTTSSPLDSLQNWGRPDAVFNPNIVDELSTWLKQTLKR